MRVLVTCGEPRIICSMWWCRRAAAGACSCHVSTETRQLATRHYHSVAGDAHCRLYAPGQRAGRQGGAALEFPCPIRSRRSSLPY